MVVGGKQMMKDGQGGDEIELPESVPNGLVENVSQNEFDFRVGPCSFFDENGTEIDASVIDCLW